MADIVLEHVTKRYPDGYEAVRDLNLTIQDGEFMILVGPSGCGKSTALNMVAGLEDISEGELRIAGEVVNQKSPRDRDIAMVFQSYALYPHMTVRDNMAFALKLAKEPKDEIERKVREVAEILDLTDHLDRKPSQLSGGQRQRVAMGRAIVRQPKAFLMDEPLSNLDAKLRVQMRTELARIQNRLNTTTLYVTHDQTEAMTLGDRVAVLRAGVLQQVGSPMELYSQPLNLFVAGFIGSPGMNFLPGQLEGGKLKMPMAEVDLPQALAENAGRSGGSRPVIVGIRPESFEDATLMGDARAGGLTFTARIEVLEAMGAEYYAHFTVSGEGPLDSDQLRDLQRDAGTAEVPGASSEGRAVARLDATSSVKEGQDAELWVDSSKIHLFDPATGQNLAIEAG